MDPVSKTATETGNIEQVNSFKPFGLHLYSKCVLSSWASHTQAILPKTTQQLYFVKQLKQAGVPGAQLLHFYLAVIQPVLENAAPVWHRLTTKARTEQIEAIQGELFVSSMTSPTTCHTIVLYEGRSKSS